MDVSSDSRVVHTAYMFHNPYRCGFSSPSFSFLPASLLGEMSGGFSMIGLFMSIWIYTKVCSAPTLLRECGWLCRGPQICVTCVQDREVH